MFPVFSKISLPPLHDEEREHHFEELFVKNATNIKDFIQTYRRQPSFLSDDLYEKSLGHLLMLYRNHYKRRFVSLAWRDGRRERLWREVFGNMEILQ